MNNKKQIIALGIVVCTWALSCYLLFYFCRQHQVILDNRSVEVSTGKNYASLPEVLVAINGELDIATENKQTPIYPADVKPPFISFNFWPAADSSIAKPIEMMARERSLIKVIGPSFNLKMEVRDRMGEIVEIIEKDIYLGARRGAMLRLVKVKNGLEGFIEEFPGETINKPRNKSNN